MLSELINRNKKIILYIIFGVLTTAVNYVVYLTLYKTGLCSNLASTIISWFAATVFAFVTNKLFVFNSRSYSLKALIYEIGSFYFFRIGTGVLDVAIMWLTVDIMSLSPELFKLISNILVIILNYLASKLVIFKKK